MEFCVGIDNKTFNGIFTLILKIRICELVYTHVIMCKFLVFNMHSDVNLVP